MTDTHLLESDDWLPSVKATLEWFIEIIGEDEWVKRRATVVAYFKGIEKKLKEPTVPTPENYSRFAFYEDWMSWYMYLMECSGVRVHCDDPMQSGRIYPIFAAIGRRVEELKKVPGLAERLKNLMNVRQNQPDSTLFELLVALCYLRNGWSVRFLPEVSEKTPDFEVNRGDQTYLVECKRLAKATDYAEQERQLWQKQWRHLADILMGVGLPFHVDITFKVPLETLPEEASAAMFQDYIRAGGRGTGDGVSNDDMEISATLMDLKAVNRHLRNNYVRSNSPQLIKLLIGDYDYHGSYTNLIAVSEMAQLGPDDGLHCCNNFVGGIRRAYSAKWECIADHSISNKAKDVRKTLSNAVKQFPPDKPGIIHIGYETANGPMVEFARQEKIKGTMVDFDFGEKKIDAVFFHAMQMMSELDKYETAETTLHFGRMPPDDILPERLLVDAPGTAVVDGTHWVQDAITAIERG